MQHPICALRQTRQKPVSLADSPGKLKYWMDAPLFSFFLNERLLNSNSLCLLHHTSCGAAGSMPLSSFVLSSPQPSRECWSLSVLWDRWDRSKPLRQHPLKSQNVEHLVWSSLSLQGETGTWEFPPNYVVVWQWEELLWEHATNFPASFDVAGFVLMLGARAPKLVSRVFTEWIFPLHNVELVFPWEKEHHLVLLLIILIWANHNFFLVKLTKLKLMRTHSIKKNRNLIGLHIL